MSASKTIALLISLLAVLAGFLWLRSSPAPAPPMVIEQLPADKLVQTKPDNTDAGDDIGPDSAEGSAACLTMDQVRARPLVRSLMKKLDAAAVEGDDIETFRGIDANTVRGFAEQGDAAAMAVTGAILVMQAFKMPDSLAVDWLNSGGHLDGAEMRLSPSSEASLILNDAAFWFYEAALNGRVMALQHYGQVRGQVFGGPVGLGWMSQEEYDSLEFDQLDELSPENMYRRVALDLAPATYEEFIRPPARIPSEIDIADRVRDDLHHEFAVTLSESDLPPPIIAAGEAAELEKLGAQICDPE